VGLGRLEQRGQLPPEEPWPLAMGLGTITIAWEGEVMSISQFGASKCGDQRFFR